MHRSIPGGNARLLSSFSCQQSGVAEECTHVLPRNCKRFNCKLFAITSALLPYRLIHSCTLRSARRYFCLQVFCELSGGRKITWQFESFLVWSTLLQSQTLSRRKPSRSIVRASCPVMVESSSSSKAPWTLSTSVWIIYSSSP